MTVFKAVGSFALYFVQLTDTQAFLFDPIDTDHHLVMRHPGSIVAHSNCEWQELPADAELPVFLLKPIAEARQLLRSVHGPSDAEQ